MKTPTLSSLNGLADIGLRSGVDMRPTLIRVLTDLYVQKLTHTADEERHYTELALRLLDGVDVPTRATIAARHPNDISRRASFAHVGVSGIHCNTLRINGLGLTER